MSRYIIKAMNLEMSKRLIIWDEELGFLSLLLKYEKNT